MFFTYLRRELRGRSRQTAIVAIGMALAIALVILVNSVSTGVKNAQSEVLQSVYGVGTDITVTQPETAPGSGQGGPQSFAFGKGDGSTSGTTQTVSSSRVTVTRGTGVLPSSDLATVTGTTGVKDATGVLSLENIKFNGQIQSTAVQGIPSTSSGQGQGGQGDQGGQGQGGQGGQGFSGFTGGGPSGGSFNVDRFSVLGIDPAASTIGPMTTVSLSDGRLLTADDANANVAVLDSGYATDASLSVGGTINIGGTDFTIVGIVSSTSTSGSSASNVYIPLAVAQTLSGETDSYTSIYVQADSSNDISAVKASLSSSLSGATINTQEDLASSVSGSLATASGLITSLGFWLSLAVLIAAFLIATLFTISGVGRRTREFGTLKAIGWRNGRITAQVAGESLVQGIIGGVIGLVVGVSAVLIVNAAGITLSGSTTSSNFPGFPGRNQGGQAMQMGSGAMPTASAVANSTGAGSTAVSTAAAAARKAMNAASEHAVTLHATLTPSVIALAIGLAILGGLVAGAFGGWRASRLRPAEALRSVA